MSGLSLLLQLLAFVAASGISFVGSCKWESAFSAHLTLTMLINMYEDDYTANITIN